MMRADDKHGHLDEGVMAAYVDRRLDGPEGRGVEAHLAECDTCRAEVVEVARLVRGGRRPRILATAGLGVAAAAALVIALGPWGGAPPEAPVLRDAPDGASAIVAISPADSVPLLPASVRFAWHPVDTGASYRVTVTDARGDLVWTSNTTDTAVSASTSLEPGTAYFWYVDALLLDGRTATTGLLGFRTGP